MTCSRPRPPPWPAAALRRIAELYAVETAIRGRTAAERYNVRQSSSADAIRYALTRWNTLCCFLSDGRIELDVNTVERAIRPITLGRKNPLFAGSDGGAERWATAGSLITTAKLNDIEPFAYLRDILERMSAGHPMSQLDNLLP